MAITLKAARINAGLTQAEAAELIGVTKVIIGNWERGISFPKITLIENIEKAYGVPCSDLIFLPKKNG